MTKTKKGLGRGLEALFGDDEPLNDEIVQDNAPASGSGPKKVGVEQLKPGKLQPRSVFDEPALAELAESIKRHGILQPLVVRTDKENPDTYEIIAGERRWRASQMAGLHEVPIIVKDLDDAKVLEIGLVENLQREDLNPVEEAYGYQNLISKFHYTQAKAAEIIGKSRSHVANMMRLLDLPDVVLDNLEKGELTMGHARAILNAENREELAKYIIKEGLSVRQTEALVASGEAINKKSTPKSKGFKTQNADVLALQEELSRRIGLKVLIKPSKAKKNTGTLQVEYKNLDQFDEICKILGQQ